MKNYNILTIEDLREKIDKKARLIGIDMGTKRIGISICDENRSIATPYTTIQFSTLNKLINEIKKIINENSIKAIIIGNPINMDGSEGRSSQSVKDKAKLISDNLKIPIALWDERLSTVGSFNISSQLDINISKRIKNIDQNSACFILQGAIDFLNN
tara:strand:- start:8 stop:478 length:471 start_codon:yes stop_codon:yes gene_type:complete